MYFKRRFFRDTWLSNRRPLKYIVYETSKIYNNEISTIYEYKEKKSMTIGCNI